jgi:hypothetical protein
MNRPTRTDNARTLESRQNRKPDAALSADDQAKDQLAADLDQLTLT